MALRGGGAGSGVTDMALCHFKTDMALCLLLKTGKTHAGGSAACLPVADAWRCEVS